MEQILEKLKALESREYEGLAGLADAACAVIESAGFGQGRKLVADMPSRRTLRYYSSEGLLPPAAYFKGSVAVYGYVHLLSVCVIKRLQSFGLSLRTIRQVIVNQSVERLEELTIEEVTITADPAEFRELQMKRKEQALVITDPDEIGEIRSAGAFQSGAGGAAENDFTDRGAWIRMPTSPERWRRYTVRPGVEIHFSDSDRLDETDRREIVRKIGEFLENRQTFR